MIVALPAFNEEPNLPVLFDGLRATLEGHGIDYEVIVVDDGSKDRTADLVREYAGRMPMLLVQHPVNLGLGATLRDCLQTAVERAGERDVVITMDADATHPPGLMIRMLQMIEEGFDVVIGSRFQPMARVYGVSLPRRMMTRCASILMRTLFPMGVRDFTCGYRAYRASALRQAMARYGSSFVDQEGFQCMLDVLLKLRPMNFVIGEVPMVLRYDLKGGVSKMRLGRTAKNSLLLLAKRRFG
ncbi:MAG: glycosyltransferase [Deltaproteobacteria bacterium]|nr:glycosyltransferase [Deltaproteobacteria bacterium]